MTMPPKGRDKAPDTMYKVITTATLKIEGAVFWRDTIMALTPHKAHDEAYWDTLRKQMVECVEKARRGPAHIVTPTPFQLFQAAMRTSWQR